MAQINPRTLADAKDLGDGIYELILTNWGNRGARQDPNNGSIQYPPVKSNANGSIPIIGMFQAPAIPSLAAIAISPRSDVDRCILHFSGLPQTPSSIPTVPPNGLGAAPNFIQPPPLPQVPPPGGNVAIEDGFINRGGILETEQVLSVGAPLIGQLIGPIIVRAHPATWFSDTYEALVTGTETPYGTAVNASTMSGANTWTNPELRLLLYLNSKGTLPPTKRAPFHRNYQFVQNSPSVYVAVPVMGRRHVKVFVRNVSGAGTFDVQITGTFHDVTEGVGPVFATHTNPEVLLCRSQTVAAESSQGFAIDTPGVPFLLITTTAGGLVAPSITVDAFD